MTYAPGYFIYIIKYQIYGISADDFSLLSNLEDNALYHWKGPISNNYKLVADFPAPDILNKETLLPLLKEHLPEEFI